MRVLFLFVDGVGLGDPNPEVNPLVAAEMPVLHGLLGEIVPTRVTPRAATAWASLVPTDASLGVSGLPQSATGQAAILTGANVPAHLGEHYGPRPDGRLRPLLEQGTLFHRVRAAGRTVAFANAYPARYFEAVNGGRRVPGAFAYAARAADVRLRDAHDLAAGHALSVDFTNRAWRETLGYVEMPLRTPEESGRLVARLLRDYDLVVVEQWATDMLGHRRDREGSLELLSAFDRFLGGVLEEVDLDDTLVLIGSDHGNLEDLRTRRHTLNPVPTVLIGANHAALAQNVRAITDIYGVILQAIR